MANLSARTLAYINLYAVLGALENLCEIDPEAKKIEKMSYDDIIKNELKVMDTAACALCKQNKIPIIVFDFKAKGSLEKIMDGEAVGTYVS